MKLIITTAAIALTLTGCASVAPFGDGAYVAKVATDMQNPQLVADAYCDKQDKVAYIENATAKRAVFTCRSSAVSTAR
jgi:hypothetical protein